MDAVFYFKHESVLECLVCVLWKADELQDVDGEVWNAFVISSQEMSANSIHLLVVSDIEEMATKSLC